MKLNYLMSRSQYLTTFLMRELQKYARNLIPTFFRVDQERVKKHASRLTILQVAQKSSEISFSCIFWQYYPHQVSTLGYI